MSDDAQIQVVEPHPGLLAGRMRKLLGLRQIAVAKMLGISRPALSAYEKGKGKLRPEIEQRLGDFIDEKLVDLANSGGLDKSKMKGSVIEGSDCRHNREMLGVTQRELADRADLHHTSIALFEAGHSQLSPDERKLLNEAFEYFHKEKTTDSDFLMGRWRKPRHIATEPFDWTEFVYRLTKLDGQIEGVKEAYKGEEDSGLFQELETDQENLKEWVAAVRKSNPVAGFAASDGTLEYERKYLPQMERRVKELSEWASSPRRAINKLEKRVEALEKENELMRQQIKQVLK